MNGLDLEQGKIWIDGGNRGAESCRRFGRVAGGAQQDGAGKTVLVFLGRRGGCAGRCRGIDGGEWLNLR